MNRDIHDGGGEDAEDGERSIFLNVISRFHRRCCKPFFIFFFILFNLYFLLKFINKIK